MCYSAMVKQHAKKLGIRFSARVQIDEYQSLFSRRLAGEKILINKGMEVQFLADAETMQEKGIARDIREWHRKEVSRLEAELAKQQERLAKAEEALKKKETKKALEDQRIAKGKIKKFTNDIKRHQSEKIESEAEDRIFPLHYFSCLLLNEKGEKVITPVRYLMRPHDKDPSFDFKFGGCYNARLDSLKKVKWWSDSLDGRRGIMVIQKFFENVPTQRYLENFKLPTEAREEANQVVSFVPEGGGDIVIPILWDLWEGDGETLVSAALITDDPLPEVQATGHDRTPIFLRESRVEDWLYAPDADTAIEVLKDREVPVYQHAVLGVG